MGREGERSEGERERDQTVHLGKTFKFNKTSYKKESGRRCEEGWGSE